MSSRVGPIFVAITSVAFRLSGEHASADILALAALGTLTIALRRSGDLQTAATAVRSMSVLESSRTPRTA